jgi:hypothetical protein
VPAPLGAPLQSRVVNRGTSANVRGKRMLVLMAGGNTVPSMDLASMRDSSTPADTGTSIGLASIDSSELGN